MTALDNLESAAHESASSPVGLPFDSYRSQAVFEAEMAAWRKDWIAVCPAGAVARPGDMYPTTVGLEPVLVVRGADGELRAISNTCSHRGTLLVDERTNAKRIRCPYHAWTYNDGGTLIAVPYDDDSRIDKAGHCLPEFRVGVWLGIVFVCLDDAAEPLATRFAGVDEWLQGYRPDEYVHEAAATEHIETWESNWKFAYENAAESYHLFRVHPKTLEPYTPTRNAFHLEGSARWTLTGGTLQSAGGDTRTGLLKSYRTVTERIGKSIMTSGTRPGLGDFYRTNYTLVCLPPSLVGAFLSNAWAWLIFEPVSPSEVRIRASSLSPMPGSRTGLALSEKATSAFLAEDKWICERNQRGIAARHNNAGQLVAMERVIGDFHQWIGWQVFGNEPEPGWRLAEPAKAHRQCGPP